MMRKSHSRASIASLACGWLAIIAGCQTTTVKPISHGYRTSVTGGSLPEQPPAPSQTPEQATANDPCAARMTDIEGALLLYFALNKHLPPDLESARSIADTELNFNCPVSGQPYVYVPGGLRAPGRSKHIILHDPAPSHNGKRWCILMPDLLPGAAQAMEVLEVPEPLFHEYLPSPVQ